MYSLNSYRNSNDMIDKDCEGIYFEKEIKDSDYQYIKNIINKTELSSHEIKKYHFYVIKNNEGNVIAFGRIYEIGYKQMEISSLRVNEDQRGKKLGIKIVQELVKDKKADNEIYLACKKDLESYYNKIGFESIEIDIPEKLIHTGIWAKSQGIDFIIMKL